MSTGLEVERPLYRSENFDFIQFRSTLLHLIPPSDFLTNIKLTNFEILSS